MAIQAVAILPQRVAALTSSCTQRADADVKQSVEVFIGLGSNLQEPLSQLQAAFAGLHDTPAISKPRSSAVYRTEPMGPADQPDYLNAVVQCHTSLSPIELLDCLQALENSAGRVRDKRWGPRSLDLDLLLYGNQAIDTPRLVVPHPGIADRSFVLYPLFDLAPELELPGKGLVKVLRDQCPQLGISRLQSSL